MLAERRRRPRLGLAIAVDQDLPVDQRQWSFGRMYLLVEGPEVLDLRIVQYFCNRLHRREWNVRAIELRHPVRAILAGNDGRKFSFEDRVVAHPGIARGKP